MHLARKHQVYHICGRYIQYNIFSLIKFQPNEFYINHNGLIVTIWCKDLYFSIGTHHQQLELKQDHLCLSLPNGCLCHH